MPIPPVTGYLNGHAGEQSTETDSLINGTGTVSGWSKAWEGFLEELHSDWPHGEDNEGLVVPTNQRQKPFNWNLAITIVLLLLNLVYFSGQFVTSTQKDSNVTATAIQNAANDIRALQNRTNDLEKSLLGLQKDIERMKDEHDHEDPRAKH